MSKSAWKALRTSWLFCNIPGSLLGTGLLLLVATQAFRQKPCLPTIPRLASAALLESQRERITKAHGNMPGCYREPPANQDMLNSTGRVNWDKERRPIHPSRSTSNRSAKLPSKMESWKCKRHYQQQAGTACIATSTEHTGLPSLRFIEKINQPAAPCIKFGASVCVRFITSTGRGRGRLIQ